VDKLKALKNALLVVCYILLGGTLLCELLVFFAPQKYYFDLLSHLVPHYLTIQVICLIVFFILRYFKTSCLAALFIVYNVILLAPLFLPASTGSMEGGEKLKLLVFNINLRNDAVEDVVEYVKRMDPDVFCLLETDLSWESIYNNNFKNIYGFKKSELRTDCFGVLFCSRLPVKDANIIYLSESKVPSTSAKVILKGREIQITVVHPLPPGKQWTFEDRNMFLQNVGELMKANGGLQILTGDLNTTPWNWSFRKLLKTSGLKDSGRGLGFQPTWLAGSTFLKMPIDHCLISPEIAVIKREIGPVLGSDHYPQYLELRIP